VIDADVAVRELKAEGVQLVATDLSADMSPYQADFTKPLALMIGNESRGLDDEMLALADVKVRLPMSEQVESLNASVASGVLMYEVVRQRGWSYKMLMKIHK
jgi:tRNA G18 (ribose-2'-O)-methylase SpoU